MVVSEIEVEASGGIEGWRTAHHLGQRRGRWQCQGMEPTLAAASSMEAGIELRNKDEASSDRRVGQGKKI